ncbi:MAG: electron transport complex subunit E [Clostridia bacterium]|nr:electron transport complex subunit E [Clostridia bacterium]MBQ2272327.1 electron transport complex subunit E [Clostridia bacterium]MBQ5820049.1 electron transport complex subunit E [Clostridia bacterium]
MSEKKPPSVKEIFRDGLLDRNPIFVQLLGMCSTLAISTSVLNGIGMGLSVTFVLILSNLFISVFRKAIPSKIRIASYIVIIAGFVTVVDMLLQAFIPSLASSLGLFIPLIVVNCLILARAESFASRHGPLPSLVDGLAMGLGYTVALVIISAIRELLGNGTLLGIRVLPDAYSPAVLVISPVGGFLILGALIALVEWIRRLQRKKKEG